MSETEAEERLSATEVDENQCGVILGYWDHEKTSELIQDLEQSVISVEEKCIKLLEELIEYKKYSEKLGELDFQLYNFKKKNEESRSSHFFSGSDPDIAFRRNLINFQKMQQVFEEKFEEKLIDINEKLSETASKIGLKNNIVLFPTQDYLKALKAQTADDQENNWYDLLDKFTRLKFLNGSTKSDSLITEQNGKTEFSKITKKELKLYQKLSRLTIKRKKKQKKKKGRKSKFFQGKNLRVFGKKKTPRCCPQDLEFRKVEKKNLKFREKKRKNEIKGLRLPEKNMDHSPRDSGSPINYEENVTESEIEKMCESFAENMGKSTVKSGVDSLKFQPTLSAAIRKVIPFTTCTSTSRSYNIGLNIQQLLSLSKHKKKTGVRTSVSEKMDGSSMAQNIKSVDFKQNLSTLNDRKTRSKYTGTSAGGILEYHKSTMSRYTNGRKSMIKSESKTAYAMGSKIMVSDCQRTDFFEIEKNSNRFENASGDGSCNDECIKLNMEWTKVYNSFLSVYRNYKSLKKKISCNNSVLADEELKYLENEIDCSIGKYKDFLNVYFKFLFLNHQLKSLKIACETKTTEPVTSFSSYCQEKLCQYRPISAMTLKKTLREVQALQDRIRLFVD